MSVALTFRVGLIHFLRTSGVNALIERGDANQLAQVLSAKRSDGTGPELDVMSIAPLLARIARQRGPELSENVGALLHSRGAFKELAPPTLTGFETLPCSASGNGATSAIVAELEISRAKARMDAFMTQAPQSRSMAELAGQFERAKTNLRRWQAGRVASCMAEQLNTQPPK